MKYCRSARRSCDAEELSDGPAHDLLVSFRFATSGRTAALLSKGKIVNETYSFCESVTATNISPWCVRRVTDNRIKASGGIDSDALCRRVKAPYGWDIPGVKVTLTHPSICPKCKAILERQTDE